MKQEKATPFWQRIATKTCIIILLGLMLPLSLLLAYSSSRYANYIRDELGKRTISQLQKSEDEIYLIFQRMVNIAGVICNDAEFQRALENEQMSRYEKTLLFDEVVNGIEINNLYDMGGIKITCFDADNNVYANWGTNYNNYQFLFEQPWVQSSIGENGYVQWNMFAPSYVLEENGNTNYVSLAKSLMSPSGGRRLATVIVSLEQDYLSRALKPFFCEPDDAVYICTEDGQIVLGLDGSGTFTQDDITEILREECAAGAGSSIVTLSDRKELLSYYTLSRQFTFNGEVLKVLHLTSYAMLTSDVTRLQTQINTLLIVCVLVLAGVLIWVTNVLTRPIVALSEKMLSYQMEEGVTGLDFTRKDEVGRLNRAFRQMSDTIRSLFEKQKTESEAREKYQYEALRAQVNPHFLFNTLNAIRWMAIIRKADNIVECIDALATMLKYSMSRGGELVTLKDELDNINSYIYIYNCRYGNQFTLETDLDRELLELQVVKFILQPIVENAVIHGFKGSEKQGTIMIYGDVENGVLKLYVEDNGCGLQNGEAEAQSGRKVTGIGIANVDARIKSAYGAQYGLLVHNGAACGTVAEFTLPVLRQKEEIDAESTGRG